MYFTHGLSKERRKIEKERKGKEREGNKKKKDRRGKGWKEQLRK